MVQLFNKKRNKKGFTLIELIVVIAILAILAAILIPRFTGFQDKARKTQVVTDAKQIATAIEALIAESPTGAITGAAIAAPVLSPLDPVIALSGVLPSRLVTIGYNTTGGGFTISETINSKTYTATRADSDHPITVTP